MSTSFMSRRAVVALLSGVCALGACGGGEVPAPRSEVRSSAVSMPEPLFDAHGRARLSPASLLPADTAARTRAGLYATRAQLEWEELTSAPTTVLLDVDALGTGAAAVQLAEQVRHWRDTRGLAFFVRARKLADAAQVVNTLADAGFAPVFMVL